MNNCKLVISTSMITSCLLCPSTGMADEINLSIDSYCNLRAGKQISAQVLTKSNGHANIWEVYCSHSLCNLTKVFMAKEQGSETYQYVETVSVFPKEFELNVTANEAHVFLKPGYIFILKNEGTVTISKPKTGEIFQGSCRIVN